MNAPLHREMPGGTLDAAAALDHATRQWDSDIVRQLTDYIQIPAKSPGFDKDWATNGYIETVLRNAAQWVEAQKVEGLTLEIIRLEGRTPVLFFEVAATQAHSSQTVLMYGHLDKQPEFSGWRAGPPHEGVRRAWRSVAALAARRRRSGGAGAGVCLQGL